MRTRMPSLVRWLGWSATILSLVLVLALGGGYALLWASLPQVDGTIRVSGLNAPVTVVRDRWAVPHIEAGGILDASFTQGFVHAQDRLWQMEFQRRLGAGRLAEIVGPAALPSDRFMRMLGLYRQAQASIRHLESETVAWLEAYAAGVNAFLASRKGPLPPEFLLLRHFDPEPWTPADSLVWMRMMALDLSENWRSEILRARLAQRLSREQIADIWPDYPKDAPVTLAAGAGGLLERLAAALPPAPAPGQGSNAWVVSGARSATGMPLLANDPHLGLRAPGVWYLVHLRSPERELIGASLPGVPGIILGHNGSIAWGLTTTGTDVQDIFIERIDPHDPARYLAPDGPAPFEEREEVIRVRREDPVVLRVRATRHGPVISDLITASAGVLEPDTVAALAWTALAEDDTSLQALFKVGGARDWKSFTLALRDVVAPQQNVFYADVKGHIGLYVPGRVPVRRRGDGRWPVPGWSGAYDWTGWIPFEDLPHALDPPGGTLFNANNKVVAEDYPYFLAADWEAPYRAHRIAELLGHGAHSLESFAAMQGDLLSMLARDLLPLMLAAPASSERTRQARERLAAWDQVARADAAPPLIFASWLREFTRLVYADEVGDLFPEFWAVRPRFLEHVLRERQVWCDDTRTPERESCADMLARALELALDELGRRFGNETAGWRWGEAHPARMAHPVFREAPYLARLFNIEVPTGGDGTTLDVGHYAIASSEHPFASIHAASYRGLYDLANLDQSRFIAASGQSGHPLSAHYRDLVALWAADVTVPMIRNSRAYRVHAAGELRLEPEP